MHSCTSDAWRKLKLKPSLLAPLFKVHPYSYCDWECLTQFHSIIVRVLRFEGHTQQRSANSSLSLPLPYSTASAFIAVGINIIKQILLLALLRRVFFSQTPISTAKLGDLPGKVTISHVPKSINLSVICQSSNLNDTQFCVSFSVGKEGFAAWNIRADFFMQFLRPAGMV